MSGSAISRPLKWHGGKEYLADWIIGAMPAHTHYVELFFGGGAVFFNKPYEGISEVVNDAYGELMNFWRVVQERELFENFRQMAASTPMSEQLWQESLERSLDDDEVQRAWKFFVRYRQSRQGLGKDFATLSRNRTRRGMNEQASSWLSAIDGLPAAHERLQGVVVLNRDAIDVIGTQDGPNTLFYADPPYLHETRQAKDAYQHEMTTEQHQQLLGALSSIEGQFILSGYSNPLYGRVAEERGWRRFDREIDVKASSKETKPRVVESLWMNFDPSATTAAA